LAKSILKQFDIPKTKPGAILDEAVQALANLAKELDSEECIEQEAWETDEDEDDKDGKDGKDDTVDTDDDDKDDDDNLKVDNRPLDTWVDLHEGLTEEEVSELKESMQPVRSMLVKVLYVYEHELSLVLTWYIAASARLCSQEFHDYSPPPMVCNTISSSPPKTHDAT
jgi:hypothetical protein